MSSRIVDVDHLIAELLNVNVEKDPDFDPLDALISGLPGPIRGSREDCLKEWFISLRYIQHIQPLIAEQLGAPACRRLCHHAGIKPEDIVSLKKGTELAGAWLRHHGVPDLPEINDCGRCINDFRRLSRHVRLYKGKKQIQDSARMETRKRLERFAKQLLAYTWGLLAKCPSAMAHISDHYDRRKKVFYEGIFPPPQADTIACEMAMTRLTMTPLLSLLDSTRKLVERSKESSDLLRTFISDDWNLREEEIDALRQLANEINPEFHDGTNPDLSDDRLADLIEKTYGVCLIWNERRMLPRIVVRKETIYNLWGISVRLLDVSTAIGEPDTPENRSYLFFYKEKDPPGFLDNPTFAYSANNPVPVRFELVPVPEATFR